MTICVVLGALLGTQNGREVEIVNTFELAVVGDDTSLVDHEFLVSRRDQCAPLLVLGVIATAKMTDITV